MTDNPEDKKTCGQFSDEPDHVVRQKCRNCWPGNVASDIKIRTEKVFKKYLSNGQYSDLEARTQWVAHYRMIIPLRTGDKARIQMTFDVSKMDSTVTDQDVEMAKQAIRDIPSVWDNHFTLKITDKKNSECGSKTFPVVFDLWFAEDETKHKILEEQYKAAGNKTQAIEEKGEKQHHAVHIYERIPKEFGVDRPHLENGNTFVIDKNPDYIGTKEQRRYLFAHEFGHGLGLPDEYGYDEVIDSVVQYYKSDGSLDSMKYPAPAFPSNKNQAKPRVAGADPYHFESIMGVYNSIILTERQGWVFGIVAQKLLDKFYDGRYRVEVSYS